jgi:hypothetical protein
MVQGKQALAIFSQILGKTMNLLVVSWLPLLYLSLKYDNRYL